ncbi:hypothetical protein QUC32_22715 [Novosphingobium resinovorum]|uniref:Lipoprotein n=1 Tax=Novosphingobium resinovorum TaxID=158500 RepID=A0A1D8A4M8_9SPHN|nr:MULTISPECIES: hypothetical protein [Sphingomonadaceae]AOR77073.1 hypothetical protein BES08_10155 [Novosphingobium resinovorum]EJU13535.1 hypothetical protein LH128_08281 [Sphingomonas sp. LH128]MBF7012464.1 hypothetical protein [Novosphingobium sp. HR1a]WJM27202.1 hypothetical protein QUC32_22715 [Novosphingobium resinovorum]
MRTPVALLLATVALAACSQEGPGETLPPEPAAEATGAAVDCLSVTRFNTTRIRDDHTIDFIGGAGGQVWRVTLPNRCSGLKSAGTFTYETSLSQLCRQDIIYPLQQIGNQWQRMGGCGMGPFVPVKLAK